MKFIVFSFLLLFAGCNQTKSDIEVSTFSYSEHAKIYKDNNPGVKHDGFKNINEQEISNAEDALERGGKLNKVIATLCYGADAIRSVIKYYGKADTVIFVRYTLAVSYLNKAISVPLYKLVCFALPVSEYFFYLDVSPEKLLERVKKRNEKEEMFENYEAFVKVRQKAEPVLYNWHVIPADDSPEEIFAKIETILDELDSKLLGESKKLE